MSEDNIELDFLEVFCILLGDDDPEIRIIAASGLWETTSMRGHPSKPDVTCGYVNMTGSFLSNSELAIANASSLVIINLLPNRVGRCSGVSVETS